MIATIHRFTDRVFGVLVTEPAGPRPSGTPRLTWAQLGRLAAFRALTVGLLIQVIAWPVRPRTVVGWIMAATAALFVAVLRGTLEVLVYDSPMAHRVQARTAHEAVSTLRIAYLLGAGAIAVTIAVAVIGLAAAVVRVTNATPFVSRHVY